MPLYFPHRNTFCDTPTYFFTVSLFNILLKTCLIEGCVLSQLFDDYFVNQIKKKKDLNSISPKHIKQQH